MEATDHSLRKAVIRRLVMALAVTLGFAAGNALAHANYDAMEAFLLLALICFW